MIIYDSLIIIMTSLITIQKQEIPTDLICPITGQLMKNPVITQNGQTYEKEAIEEWFTRKKTDPLTRMEINTHLIPNYSLRKICDEYREKTLKGVEIATEETKEKLEKQKAKLKEQQDQLKKQQDKLKEQQDQLKELEKKNLQMNNNESIHWGEKPLSAEHPTWKFNRSINKVRNWTVQEVLTWLRSMKLVKYLSAFERHNVNGKKLCEIFYKFECYEDVDYLENTLGVKVRLHRVRLLRAFRQLGDQSITLPTTNGSVTITHSNSTIIEQFRNDYGTVSRTTTTTSNSIPDENGNINCTNCVGCKNCIGCTNCRNCDRCTGCTNCKYCTGCTGCANCNRCIDCTGCANCERCDSCTGCQNCEGCTDCISCQNCTHCTNCKNCTCCYSCTGCTDCRNFWDGINCENCNGGKDCTDCKNCFKCTSCKECKNCINCFMCYRCVAIVKGDNLRNCSY